MTPDLIPPASIAVLFAYDALMWFLFHKDHRYLNYRYYVVFGFCFLMQAVVYLVFWLFPVDIHVRGFWVRMSLINLAICFGLPMTIQWTSKQTR